MPRKSVKKYVDRPSSYETSVWYKDKSNTLLRETDHVAIYKDKYPACDGHLLFVPKINQPRFIGEAMSEAYYHGQTQYEQGKCDGFNVGMNIGEDAGQSVFWPHIHFIPRHKGDQKDEPRGIRQCFPNDPFAPGNTVEDYYEMQARLKKERRAYIDEMQKKLEAIGGKFNYNK